MNWNDPNSVAIFAAWGQWAGAIGSFLAVVVAVGIAIWSARQAYKQSRQARYDSARPVLSVSSKHNSTLYPIRTQQGCNNLLDWTSLTQTIVVKNVGSGTAFNVMSILYGPESVVENNQRYVLNNNRPWAWTMSSLGSNDNELCVHDSGSTLFYEGNMHIESYSFLAPAQPDNPDDQEPTYICRVVVTYHDIFKCKHASIFDYDIDGNWTMHAVLEDIPYDLHDLKGLKYPVSKVTLLKRFKKRLPRINISISRHP